MEISSGVINNYLQIYNNVEMPGYKQSDQPLVRVTNVPHVLWFQKQKRGVPTYDSYYNDDVLRSQAVPVSLTSPWACTYHKE